jgi:hypothetical protein
MKCDLHGNTTQAGVVTLKELWCFHLWFYSMVSFFDLGNISCLSLTDVRSPHNETHVRFTVYYISFFLFIFIFRWRMFSASDEDMYGPGRHLPCLNDRVRKRENQKETMQHEDVSKSSARFGVVLA